MGTFMYLGTGTCVGDGIKVSVGEHDRAAAVMVETPDGAQRMVTPAELVAIIDAAAASLAERPGARCDETTRPFPSHEAATC